MSFIELFLIAVGLSMDAFAVSICKGLTLRHMEWSRALLCGLWFGVFQALMPVIGYFAGRSFADTVAASAEQPEANALPGPSAPMAARATL